MVELFIPAPTSLVLTQFNPGVDLAKAQHRASIGFQHLHYAGMQSLLLAQLPPRHGTKLRLEAVSA